MNTLGPRPVAIHGHQEYWRGWFHGWTPSGKADGGVDVVRYELEAIVENGRGVVTLVPAYKVTFLRPLPEPPTP